MKNPWICLLASFMLASCSHEAKKVQETEQASFKQPKFTIDSSKQSVDTLLLSLADTAFVVKRKLADDDMGDKEKQYLIKVFFSPRNWPVLIFDKAFGADIVLQGDLDGDGQPELLLRPWWFSSCWSTVNLFSLKNNTWKLVKQGNMYFCSDQYLLNERVVKTEKGYGLLTDSLTGDKFIVLKKEIKF